MGGVRSKIMRPVRNFNVENRAARKLEKQNTIPHAAPKHATTVETISKFREENPEVLDELTTKNEALHDKLKSVYLKSQGDNPEIKAQAKSKPLSREFKPETDLGVMDVDYAIPEGRLDLKTLLTVLGQHQINSDHLTAAKIAEDYRLNLVDVENVLRHYGVFQIHIPKELFEKNKKLAKMVEEQMNSGSPMKVISSEEDVKKLASFMNVPDPDSNNVMDSETKTNKT